MTFKTYDVARHICLILAGGSICMEPSADGYIPTKGQLLSKCFVANPHFNDACAPKLMPVRTIVDDTGTIRAPDGSFVLPVTSSSYKPRVRYSAFEFQNPIDSCTADANFWNTLACCIRANYDAFDGFVILHGTDTLSYAASALSFLLHPLDKPIILTGSQVSIFDERSDAWDNILGALSCAAMEEPLFCEVGVFFHHTLYRGNRTTKIHTSDYAAFGTRSTPLSTIAGRRQEVKLYGGVPPCQRSSRSKIQSPSALEPLVRLSPQHVGVLRVYPGFPSSILSSMCSAPGLRGLVLETFGAGHMPLTPELLRVIKSAIMEQDLLIVCVSQCIYGSVSAHYASARALQELGVIHGEDMTTEAAYTKLLWLVAQRETLSLAEMKSLMARNVRGELTESKIIGKTLRTGLQGGHA